MEKQTISPEEKARIDQEYRERQIERLNNMTPFEASDNEWFLPPIPIMNEEDYKKYVIPNYIRCGAIPKKDLIVGREYDGDCRNASRATWLGEEFEYTRWKFGTHYQERINHFEDDDGYDLFVPMRLVDIEI